jgi:predicted nucleic acid-binding protein
MRVFLDANILFSAAKSDGAVRRLLELLLARGHACWVDGYVVEEARRNLAAKFPEGVSALERQLASLRVARAHPRARDPDLAVGLPVPEKDRAVLAAAIHLGCEALVTGDRSHFGALYRQTIRGVAIHSPRSLAESVLGRDS